MAAKLGPTKFDALKQAALKSIKQQIVQKVKNIRDPRTGQRPKIKVKGKSLEKLSFEVSGSEEVIKAVNKALG
jgi:hypothetical protein